MHKESDDYAKCPTAVKCFWHTLQCWVRNLDKISDETMRQEIYEFLRAIIQTRKKSLVHRVSKILYIRYSFITINLINIH